MGRRTMGDKKKSSIGVSLPPQTIEILDEYVESMKKELNMYVSRSVIIEKIVREFLERNGEK